MADSVVVVMAGLVVVARADLVVAAMVGSVVVAMADSVAAVTVDSVVVATVPLVAAVTVDMVVAVKAAPDVTRTHSEDTHPASAWTNGSKPPTHLT
jgi:hypothetical protein